MFRRLLFFAATVTAALALAGGAGAQTWVFHDTEQFDLTGTWVDNPCTGETLVLQGSALFVSQIVVSDHYGYLMFGHVSGQNLSAVGLDSGTVYHVASTDSGLDTSQAHDGAVHEVVKGAGAFVLVGPDPADHFVLHASIGYTVTPNGDLIYTGGGVDAVCPNA
jgi:type 1 fimbria pilin